MSTKYVAQSAAGSQDGSSAVNAYGIAAFNANTTTPTFTPTGDDIVVLNGTLTTALVMRSSGTSGHVITYQFASGAKFSSAVWGVVNGAINTNGKSFFVIDGGTNGTIENTANGTVLANKAVTRGIVASGSGNYEIKNLIFSNLYVRTATTDQAPDLDQNQAIYSLTPGDNISIHDCIVHDVCEGFEFQVSSTNTTGISIYANDFYNINICVRMGVSAVALSTVNVYQNTFHDYAAWDDSVGNNYHHNGLHCYINSGSGTGINFYQNRFSGAAGQNTTSNLCYYESSGGSGFTSSLIYDNVSLQSSDSFGNFACIAIGGSNPVSSTCLVSNNTVIGNGSTYGILISGQSVNSAPPIKNNILKNHATAVYVYSPATSYTLDYNFYTGNTHFGSTASPNNDYNSLATWKAFLGGSNEVNGVTNATSHVNTDGTLAAGSAAIGVGLNLSASYTVDHAGVTRTLPWDMGAFKAASTSTPYRLGFRITQV